MTGLPPRIDAQGRTVLLEKDVNLDIGLRLDALAAGARAGARSSPGPRTSPAATGPTPPSGADLKARTDIANAAGVELFVSIHNNAL